MQMLICYIAVFAGVFGVFKLVVGLGLEKWITEDLMIVFAISAAVLTALYLFGSYLVSIRIIRKREW